MDWKKALLLAGEIIKVVIDVFGDVKKPTPPQ